MSTPRAVDAGAQLIAAVRRAAHGDPPWDDLSPEQRDQYRTEIRVALEHAATNQTDTAKGLPT